MKSSKMMSEGTNLKPQLSRKIDYLSLAGGQPFTRLRKRYKLKEFQGMGSFARTREIVAVKMSKMVLMMRS